MATVTNNHTSPLKVGGVTIPPKGSRTVENWHMASTSGAVRAWLKSETITADEPAADQGRAGLRHSELRELANGPTTASEPDPSPYAVKEKGAGWFAVTKDGEEVTKSLRKDAVELFPAMTEDEKATFVEANKD
ncbi:hypothetical protein U0C82_03750 [Fulvimarina sp. 2208YS6-2-32]|uniref:Uncharacterized protein n=1 Tax=Fulvimarina uroteuthidis TaxID=3098149 RepID=A0ABU5I0I1_9HYPH|nr:hypothetical protein [Fulvimarina sp. 2208YS6-2-32]MDY8108263.1 hypothetical protein [Fulvimarina sp. 2208YS6-2-32]